MTEQVYELQYGATTIHYTLTYAQRKTLSISVSPDLSVAVSAPENTALDRVQERVRQRAPWILRQQRELERYLPRQPARQYVSGETHRYLGRQYRLKIIHNHPDAVKLTRGWLYVYTTRTSETEHIRTLVEGWYMAQAERVFRERIRAMLPRFTAQGISEPVLIIKPLVARWGSCSGSGSITLNLRLMQVPKDYIDYVVVHELAHLIEHNHSRRFYQLLDRTMPDWQQRRQQLNACEVL